jgi:hypothetical protein
MHRRSTDIGGAGIALRGVERLKFRARSLTLDFASSMDEFALLETALASVRVRADF